MKKLLQQIIIGILFLSSASLNATQLSGTYTIDSAGTASTTVFLNFSSAITYLTSANTRSDGGPSNSSPFGVSGPVVFTVNQGTYTEQVNIPAITGASATNTITFDGGTGYVSSRILQFSASSTTDAHTLRCNASSFINFRNLTIKATGSAGIGVHFYLAATNNSIKQCSVIVANTTSTSVKAVAATGSNISSTGGGCSSSTGTGFNIYIDSNYISGGYIGIFLSSSSATAIPHNFYVRWNTIANAYSTGIGASSSQGYLYEGNYILMATGNTASKGIHHCNGSSTGIQSYKIIGNTIENAGQYGIQFQSNNANANVLYPTLVANNYIKPTFSNATSYGIDFSQGRNHRVYNNTILMNMAAGNGINLGSSANAGCIIKNNIIKLQAANSTGLCVISGGANLDSCDYNVFMKNSTSSLNIVTIQATTYTTSNFIGGGGFNINSTMVDPMLTSVTDPRPRNMCQKGQSTTWVVNDINGNTRGIPPQIGCAEPTGGVSTDASVVSFVLPSGSSVTSGSQDVKVLIRNSGMNTLYNVNVSVNLGSVTHTVYWSGSLSSCIVDTVTFTGSNQFTFINGSNTLKAWVDGPNYLLDSNATNDTIMKTFCSSLSGYYMIGGATPDFNNFTEVADRLNCGGISGPVYFDVASGTYPGQVLLQNIAGTSATNTITFQSTMNNCDSVIVTSASSVTLGYSGTSYVTFRAITINQTLASASNAITISGTCMNDTFENCKITNATSTTSTTYIVNVATGSNGLYFHNNFMSGAYYGLYFNGGSTATPIANTTIDGNTIQGVYYDPCYFYYHNNLKFKNNTVNLNSSNTTNYMYFYYSPNSIFANNAFSSATNITSIYIYLFYSSANVGIYNNSFNLNHTSGYGPCLYNYAASSGYDVKNNVFNNNSTGYAATFYYSPTTYPVTSDNNNFYTNGSVLIRQNSAATDYATLTAWRTAYPTLDKNSISYRAGFTSNIISQPNVADTAIWSLNGRGIYLASNPTDINGNARPATPNLGAPDIGAFEITPTSVPPLATAVPATPTAGTTQSFLFAGDSVLKIAWDPYYTPPSTIEVRQYAGVRPQFIDTTGTNYMYLYDEITIPSGYYMCDVNVFYKDNWIGTNASETILRMVRKASLNSWDVWTPVTGSSSYVDTVNNIITATAQYSLFWLTGSDVYNPLPVKLVSLKAHDDKNSIKVNWVTASEINSDYFSVERSIDLKKFVSIGKVKADGNTSTISNYSFDDISGKSLLAKGMVYYRLAMFDKNGKMEYSSRISVTVRDKKVAKMNVEVFPNPFSNQIVLNISNNESDVNVDITDISGKQCFNSNYQSNTILIDNLDTLKPGLYFVKITSNEEVKVVKLFKN